MAERHTAKVSRRRAVVALGAGVVGGAVGIGGSAAQPLKQADGVTCGPIPAQRPDAQGRCEKHVNATFVGNNPTRGADQLQLETCCKYLSQALLYGFCDAHQDTRYVLKDFVTKLQDEMSRAALRDYCFVQFDLTADELARLKETTTRMLRTAEKPKK
jgi:hypothetical protein